MPYFNTAKPDDLTPRRRKQVARFLILPVAKSFCGRPLVPSAPKMPICQSGTGTTDTLSVRIGEGSEKMRTHLGCSGQVEMGTLSKETQQNLEHVEAAWLEFVPESVSLEVRHVQPDDRPALPEIAGELIEFLCEVSDDERAQVPAAPSTTRMKSKHSTSGSRSGKAVS